MGTSQHAERKAVLCRAAARWAIACTLLATGLAMGAGGCAQNELGRFSGYYRPVIKDPQRIRNAIVKSENYWIQREVIPEEQFPGPTPEDLKSPEADYILGPGDLIEVTIFELLAPGQPYRTAHRISQTGQITLPYIGTVKCAGLTTRGLEEKVADMLEPDFLVDPQVSAFVAEYRNLNVTVINGVMRPGIYPMTRQDMTLLELVAMAGGVLQLVEDYGYIIREYRPDEADMVMLGAGAPPVEGAAPPPAAPSAPTPDAPTPAAPTPGAPARAAETPPAAEKAPAAEPKPAEIAPKAAPAAEKAPTAAPTTPTPPPEPKPAETAPKAAPTGNPTPTPAEKVPAAPAPKPPAQTGKQVQEMLEKMAAGEMPDIGRIEAAEAAADKAGPKAGPAPATPKAAPPAKAPAKTAASATTPPSAGATAAAKTAAPAATPAPEAPKTAEPVPPAPAAGGEAVAKALAKDEEELGRWVWSDGKWVEVKAEKPKEPKPAEPKPTQVAKPAEPPKPVAPPKPIEVAKPVEPPPPAETVRVATAPETPPVDEERLQLAAKFRRLGVVQGSGQTRRILRFDVRALQAGDPTQNIVLRDGDILSIPSPPVGDFYLSGEVARPGVYSLTGRKITLLQALAAAGGLTAVAVPWRTEVVRRISETEEELIYVDVSRIARGEVPDFYLQPEDLIRVGTDQGAIFNAVLRNAFRATYGLGAVYDTNFADFYPWMGLRRPFF